MSAAQGRLAALAQELRSHGVDPGQIGALQAELDVIEAPPGVLARLTRSTREAAARQWGHLVGELGESRRAIALITRRMRAGEQLSEEELDHVRAQLFDLLKVVPAGIIAAANSVFPIPGTGLLTPWVLARLGLMPSRWREAHLLHELRREAARLRAEGHTDDAERVEAVEHALEDEADAREAAAQQAALLTHWDTNNNGTWDPEEQAAYASALLELRRRHDAHRARRRWYLQVDGHVFGPVRLSQVPATCADGGMLVCYERESGWVSLEHLLPTRNP